MLLTRIPNPIRNLFKIGFKLVIILYNIAKGFLILLEILIPIQIRNHCNRVPNLIRNPNHLYAIMFIID